MVEKCSLIVTEVSQNAVFHKHESVMSSQLTQREITSFWYAKILLFPYFFEKSGEFCRKCGVFAGFRRAVITTSQ